MSKELHDERISAYLDGELAPSERAEVEELLRTSGAYQQVLAELTSLRESLKGLPQYTLGNDFAGRVLAAAKRSAGKAAAPATNATVKVKKDQSVIPLSRPRRRWLLGAIGGLVATAACVGLIIYSFSGSGENVGKVEADGGHKQNPPVVVEQPGSAFVRAIAGSRENEAVVVRVKLTKEAIKSKLLDEALKAHGIAMAAPDLSNEAAQATGKTYKELMKGQGTSSAPRNAGDVLFLEADAARLEQALSQLAKDPAAKAAFAAESLIASSGKSPAIAPKAEGEPGSENSTAKSEVPKAGYFQHLGPRGFTLPSAATPPAVSASEKVPARKSARVLIVVEVVE